MSGSEWSWAPLGETAPVASGPNSSELGNNYNNNPLPYISAPSVDHCSFRFLLLFALTLRLFHSSPGALHTPLFIYVLGDGNGLPPREEG